MQLPSNSPDSKVFWRGPYGSHGDEENIPCEIHGRYWVNSCSVLFLNLEYITWSPHDNFGRGMTSELKPIVVWLPPIWSNDYFLFFSMPAWMSSGTPCVAPVRFMKVLSVWSVNNIPRKNEKISVWSWRLKFLCVPLKKNTLLLLETSGDKKQVMPLI